MWHATRFFKPPVSINPVKLLSHRFYNTSGPSSSTVRRHKIVKACLGVITGALATCGSVIYILDRSVKASGIEAHPPSYPWSMERPLSSLDHDSIRRGWHVYKNVCATCHSVQYLSFRDLVNVSHTQEEVKALAAEYEVFFFNPQRSNLWKVSQWSLGVWDTPATLTCC